MNPKCNIFSTSKFIMVPYRMISQYIVLNLFVVRGSDGHVYRICIIRYLCSETNRFSYLQVIFPNN